MTISDWAIVCATLLSPLIAVQVQKFIERATERRTAQKRIFHSLMATRATRVSPEHVQALNAIDLEFTGSTWRRQTSKEKEVVNRWRIYASHLNRAVDAENEAATVNWNVRGDELFTDLLESLSAALGYPFDRVQLSQGIYYPRAHGEAERRREVAERAFLEVLVGNRALAMKVIEFPASDEAFNLQMRLQERLLSAIERGAIRVKNVKGGGGPDSIA